MQTVAYLIVGDGVKYFVDLSWSVHAFLSEGKRVGVGHSVHAKCPPDAIPDPLVCL